MKNKNETNENNGDDEEEVTVTENEETEAAAEAAAEFSRRRGIEMIENHLIQHLEQNPKSDYVTWIATLHPENAEISIDTRFFIPENPWWTIYETTTSSASTTNDDTISVPVATAVPVSSFFSSHQESGPVSIISQTTTKHDEKNHHTVCSPVDYLVGFIVSLSAILTIFGIEIGALVVYAISAFFYRSAKLMDPPTNGIIAGFVSSIFLLIYWTLALVDTILLLSSILTSEIVAGIAWLLSCLFAGCTMAGKWHQYIRRNCHYIRCSFRSKKYYYPYRHLCCTIKVTTAGEDNNNSTEHEHEHENGINAGTSNKRNNSTQALPSNTDDATSPTPSAPPHQESLMVPEANVFVEPSKDATYTKEIF